MEIPTLSVVMSVYNGARFLCQAIDSILNQSCRDFEFIIINDGSTDDSGRVLDFYARQDRRVRVCHQSNQGLIRSLNRGCALAESEFIARMDADDLASPVRFSRQLRFMKAHPEVAVLGTAVEFIDETGRPIRVAQFPLHHHEIQSICLTSSFLWHPSVLMRKAAFMRVGGYRHVLHAEDYDLWLRIVDHYRIANLPDILLKYRLHPAQISVTKCKAQALATDAARVAAIARRNGRPDPLDTGPTITPNLLRQWGVSAQAQQTTLARAYLATIRNMYDSGEYGLASNMLRILRSSEIEQAATWTKADLRLCAAKVHWRRREYVRSLHRTAQAFMLRPMVIGRPLKRAVIRISSPHRPPQAPLSALSAGDAQ